MEYTYEFMKLEPKRLLAQVKYSSVGREDIVRNLIVEDFTEENVLAAVKHHGVAAVNTWSKIDAAPSTLTLSGGTLVDEPTPPQPTLEMVQEEIPDFDPLTERLEECETITATQAIYGYTKVPLQGKEIAAALKEFTAQVRMQRNWLLSQTDYLLLPDMPTPDQSLLDYRKALRDVPKQAGFPENVVWPTNPMEV